MTWLFLYVSLVLDLSTFITINNGVLSYFSSTIMRCTPNRSDEKLDPRDSHQIDSMKNNIFMYSFVKTNG